MSLEPGYLSKRLGALRSVLLKHIGFGSEGEALTFDATDTPVLVAGAEDHVLSAQASGGAAFQQVPREGLDTDVESLAGVIPASGSVEVALQPYAFFPMIHDDGTFHDSIRMRGILADAADPDAPGWRFDSNSVVPTNYDVDYRYVNA